MQPAQSKVWGMHVCLQARGEMRGEVKRESVGLICAGSSAGAGPGSSNP